MNYPIRNLNTRIKKKIILNQDINYENSEKVILWVPVCKYIYLVKRWNREDNEDKKR